MRHWTLEERQKQSDMINKWAPWRKSTGARSQEGKSMSKMNASKLGLHDKDMREIARFLAECGRTLSGI